MREEGGGGGKRGLARQPYGRNAVGDCAGNRRGQGSALACMCTTDTACAFDAHGSKKNGIANRPRDYEARGVIGSADMSVSGAAPCSDKKWNHESEVQNSHASFQAEAIEKCMEEEDAKCQQQE